MSTRLIDVQAGFGGSTPGVPEMVSQHELLDDMRRLDIAGALVRITPEGLDTDQLLSNARLYEACADEPALLPCPIVLPAGGGDVPSEAEQVDGHIRQGVAAVCIRPGADNWLLATWASGLLFQALEARRLPVLCLERMVSQESLAALAERYPGLPFILAEVGYRSQRNLVPLLKTFSNIYLSIGSNYTVHRGLEHLVIEVGAERLLFGTGFPSAELMMAVTLLMYADIAEEQRRLIGYGNFERLRGGIVR